MNFSWTLEQARARGNKRWNTYRDGILDLTVAEMDLPTPPPVLAAVRDSVDRQSFGYPVADEDSGIPEVVSDYLLAEHGLAVTPGDVRLLPELMRGISQAIVHLTPAGTPVVVPTPTYGRFFDAIAVAGRAAVEVPMQACDDGYRLDLDRIDAELAAGARCVLLCHPGNPTGRVFGAAELAALAEIAVRWGARVISDEIHAPIRYDGVEFRSYASVSESARETGITLFSATKAWNFPGLRCGLVAFTNEADRKIWSGLPRAAVGGMSPLGMRATVAALTAGGPWLTSTLGFLDRNRQTLARELPREIYRPSEATYLAWVDLRGVTQDPVRRLAELGVAVSDGADHGRGGAGFVRLNFATQPGVLAEALHRMAQVW
ncbi:MalY/PatB family protein [Nocardia sp. NPDC052566]|uniref:MalY/PatB family protein n=1 Tax=Nocardia sp. NPDC052566 TaxID=3364330 RepID=UPI0037CBB171